MLLVVAKELKLIKEKIAAAKQKRLRGFGFTKGNSLEALSSVNFMIFDWFLVLCFLEKSVFGVGFVSNFFPKNEKTFFAKKKNFPGFFCQKITS